MGMDDTPLERIWGIVNARAASENATTPAFPDGRNAVDSSSGSAIGVASARQHWLARTSELLVAVAGKPYFAPEVDVDPAQAVAADFRSSGLATLKKIKGTFAVAILQPSERAAVLA